MAKEKKLKKISDDAIPKAKLLKKNFKDEEVLKKLKDIRDITLERWHNITAAGITTGSASTAELFHKASDELYRFEDRLDDKKASESFNAKISLVFDKPEPKEEVVEPGPLVPENSKDKA